MSIVIGCPWYSEARPETAFSLTETVIALGNEGIESYMAGVFDCPLIGHARAQLVAKFMATDASHLLMVDGDMAWRPESVFRLLRHDLPLVMAAGPDKRTGRFYVGLHGEPANRGQLGRARYDARRGLLYVDRIGLCFTLIRRDAVERLIDHYPDYHAHTAAGVPEALQPYYYGFFEQRCEDGVWMGEDFSFAWLCRGAGIDVVVDPWIELSHIVPHALHGRLIDQLQFADGETPVDPMANQTGTASIFAEAG